MKLPVPEPAAWVLMVVGIGLVGAILRRLPDARVSNPSRR
ncbi:MAG: PEPxxWA-CTERM sorting domain-containing protein [Caulobacteraceae bacterium]|nr:PEPxxWA-CTERM sorting domain-containing protein [Caulobacteraceae bacterium]